MLEAMAMSAEFDQQGMAAHVEIYQQWGDGRILKQIVVTADLYLKRDDGRMQRVLTVSAGGPPWKRACRRAPSCRNQRRPRCPSDSRRNCTCDKIANLIYKLRLNTYTCST